MRGALLGWHARHGRALRFRGTTDAWLVLVSEVMAQQTQIARVETAWAAFIRLFPTPAALCGGPTGGRAPGVVRARLQPAGAESPSCGAGHRGRPRRAGAVRHRGPRVAPRCRAVHRARCRGHRVRPTGRGGRHERPASRGPAARGTRRLAAGTSVGRRRAGRPDRSGRVDARCDGPRRVRVRRRASHAVAPARSSGWCATAEARASTDGSPMPVRGRRARPAAAVAFESTSRWLRGRIVERLRDARPTAPGRRCPRRSAATMPRAIASAVDALVRDGLVERRSDGAMRLPGGTS